MRIWLQFLVVFVQYISSSGSISRAARLRETRTRGDVVSRSRFAFFWSNFLRSSLFSPIAVRLGPQSRSASRERDPHSAMATTSSSAAVSVEMPSLLANPSHSSSLKATSSLSSSSSVVSRQSSTRSTSSVQAVPFRTPSRGGSVNPAYRTGNSNSAPRPLTNNALDEIPGSPDGYFVPLERIGSIPSGDRDSLRASTGDTTLLGGLRPPTERAPSSTLSDKPAKMAVSGSNGAEIMIVRKTVADFMFGDVLGEGSYSTVSRPRFWTDQNAN